MRNRATAMATPPDPRLSAALEPSRILGYVNEWFRSHKRLISVTGCKVTRVRFEEDGTVTVAYQLKAVKDDNGDKVKEQIFGTIFNGDEGEKEYQFLLRHLQGDGVLGLNSILNGFILYVPEIRLLLRTLEADHDLPSLQLALDTKRIKPYLCRSLEFEDHNDDDLEVNTAKILLYKPRARCTLQYNLQIRNPETGGYVEQVVIGKIYKKKLKSRRNFRILSELYENGFHSNSSDGISVPRPLGNIPDLSMLLMEYIPHPRLNLREAKSPQCLAVQAASAARALAKLHSSRISGIRMYRLEDEIENLTRAVALAISTVPELTPEFKSNLREILALADAAEYRETVLTHGDFGPHNILMGGGRVTLIDLNGVCNADPARDIASFLMCRKKSERKESWTEKETIRFSKNFLSAYGENTSSSFYARIKFYYKVFMLKRVCKVVPKTGHRDAAAGLLAAARSGPPLFS